MGILDYLILAGIAVGILAAVRHLKRNSGCGGCGGDWSYCCLFFKKGEEKIEKFLAKFSFQRISMG